MYSPNEKQQNDMVRLGQRKKPIIKGRRILKIFTNPFTNPYTAPLVNSK